MSGRMTRIAAVVAAPLAVNLALASPVHAACPDLPTVARLAHAILLRLPVEPYPSPMTMEDALCAQQRLVDTFSQPYGDAVGYKVGLTNPAAQQRFGVPHPLRGTIFHGTIRAIGTPARPAEIPADFGVIPTVESDLLVRVASDNINEVGSDYIAILRTIDLVIPFIEMPDLTFPPDRLDAPALVSINLGARLGVLGDPIIARPTEDFARRLGAMTVTLSADGVELARAPGTVLMGHPLNVIPWLVEDLARDGRRLRVGDYVSLGGFSPALPTRAGATVTATYEGLLDRPVSVVVRTP